MEVSDVAPALQARLGSEGTTGLLALFDTARQDWTTDVTTAAVERFERRLGDDMSSVRVALAQTEASVRQEIVEGDANLRREMGSLAGELRKEMHDQGVELRKEMVVQGVELRKEIAAQGVELRKEIAAQNVELRKEIAAQGTELRRELGEDTGSLRKDIADLGKDMSQWRQEQLESRFELLKWAFAFWIGQAVAVAGIVGLMLRLTHG